MPTYDFIQQITVTSPATQYTFSSIPQTYTDLVVILEAKSNQTGTSYNSVRVTFNNDNTASYVDQYLYGGTTTGNIGAAREATYQYMAWGDMAQASQNVLGFTRIDINHYAVTTKFKQAVGIGGGAIGGYYGAHLWKNTAAINRIDFYRDGGANSVAAPSKFTLYGIKAA